MLSKKLLFILYSSLIFIFPFALYPHEQLTREKIHSVFDQMLSYHVEFQEMNTVILKRSFKIFIDYFDPHKIYLTKEEIEQFLEPTQEDLETILSQYNSENYFFYWNLNNLIGRAILRSREMRKKIIKEIIESPLEGINNEWSDFTAFAEDTEQLQQRLKKYLTFLVLLEKKECLSTKWSNKHSKKAFDFWQKRLERFENKYLKTENFEHYFYLHLLKALAKSLDAHTNFYSSEEAFEMRMGLEKQFEGIGIILKEGINGISIVQMVKGSPAEKNGVIKPGDTLLAINGISIKEKSYEQVLELLKTKEKKIDIKLQHANGKIYEVQLTKEKIIMEEERLQISYEKYLDGIIGKLVLPSFYESDDGTSCEKDIKEAIKKLRQRGNLLGLVIDMRENGGGFLNQAVKVAGLFISSGVIVISKYAQGEVQYLREIDGRLQFEGPLILLTSKASASAAEIVAGSLQDYGTALVVGDERTYGKGTIQYQTITDPQASSFFKVTIGKYYTVSGRSTQIDGVLADIHVPTHYSTSNIGERYLTYAIKNDQVPSAYLDPLTDVDPNSRLWLEKNYLPRIQKKLSLWAQMLTLLQSNSQNRIFNNAKFLQFLKLIQDERPLEYDMRKTNVEDLQMNEAVDIVKDMIHLKSSYLSS